MSANEAKVMGSTPRKGSYFSQFPLEDCTRNYHRFARNPKMRGWLGMWAGEVMVMYRDRERKAPERGQGPLVPEQAILQG